MMATSHMDNMSSFDDTSLGQLALDKAKELFAMCDTENKGFIIKRDMQRLQNELPALTPDQLEEVFDSLDQDKNGFLTPEEFVRGFGAFLGLQIPVDTDDEGHLDSRDRELEHQDSGVGGSRDHQNNAENEENFQDIMEGIGANDLRNNDAAHQIWRKLRSDDPELLEKFEGFLTTVSSELKRTKDDYSSLENTLQKRGHLHEDQVQQLYEEMEQQIRVEKEKILEAERQKAQRQREEMERDVAEKDRELSEIVRRHAELETKFSIIASTKTLTQQENEELQRERQIFDKQKEEMEHDLERLKHSQTDAKNQLEEIKKQTREEKKKRAKDSLKVTEGIASEREQLIKELEELRTMNQRLKDEKEESRNLGTGDSKSSRQKLSVIGPYLKGRSNPFNRKDETGRDVEVDDDYIPGSVSYYDEETLPAKPIQPMLGKPSNAGSLAAELADVGERVSPQGGNEISTEPDPFKSDTPDRIFKVVFVGDSGVGKTCFLHRFCHNKFKQTFNATIGVDFTVKTINVGDRVVALQLWDTAGQERFRSITKQYFRKADGVVLMYDVTSEPSFLSLRNWMASVKEGVDDACVLCIVGNKVDLVEGDTNRALTEKDGTKLAEDNSALFFEVSAANGAGIDECMRSMALHLQEREDQHLEDALKLEMDVQKTNPKKKCYQC